MTNHYAIRDPSGALFIVLPIPSNSLNEFNGRRWYAKNKIKGTWLTLLATCPGLHTSKGEPATTRMHVDIVRIGTRALDRVNLWGGSKMLEDALVTMGLLVDDSDKWCDLHMSQRRPEKGETTHTTITIAESHRG